MEQTEIDIECKSASELIERLRQITLEDRSPEIEDRFIFRGQSNSDWNLIPSAFRQGTILGFENRQFTRRAAEMPRGTWDQGNAEWVALMDSFICPTEWAWSFQSTIVGCEKLRILLTKLRIDRARLMPLFDGVVRELEQRCNRRNFAKIPVVGTTE